MESQDLTQRPPLTPNSKAESEEGLGPALSPPRCFLSGQEAEKGAAQDTFSDLPAQPPRTMPQARQAFLTPPLGQPPQSVI